MQSVAVAAITLVCLLAACTVREEFRDGERVSRSIGLGLGLTPDCAHGGAVYRSKTYGVDLSESQGSLGYTERQLVCIPPDDCRAIFFVETPDQAAEVMRLVGDLRDVCVVPDT